MTDILFQPIGTVHTIYKEKFGIPRQAGLVDAPGQLIFHPEFAREEAVRGLEDFSHIWLLFHFHKSKGKNGAPAWSPMVRPPRLGGNKKVGVFASRSPFRPNGIGMSAVRLESISIGDKGPLLNLSGVDILDGTPILDIKPYLPYADIISKASGGFAAESEKHGVIVRFSETALAQIKEREKTEPNLKSIITGILENDPRPAYKSKNPDEPEDERIFGIRIFDFDLKWTVEKNQIQVIELIF